MSNAYLVGIGSDLALGSLSAMTPQPTSPGIIPTETHYGLTNVGYPLALHCPLLFRGMPTPTVLATLLAQFFTGSATQQVVTVYIPGTELVRGRYNATAQRPINGLTLSKVNSFISCTIELINLEAL